MIDLPPLPGLIPNSASPTPAVFPPADERRLLSAFIYAEAEPNIEDMRRVLGTAVNRAKLKGQNVFDILAAPNQYVPTLPGQRDAKYLPYLRGEVKNPVNMRATLMAENLADEFLAGKFSPPTADVSYRGRGGVNVYPPELQKETRFPTGNAKNLAKDLPPLPGLKASPSPTPSPSPSPSPSPTPLVAKQEAKVTEKSESPLATIGNIFNKLLNLWR